jgi:hypothetical protein
MDARGLLAAGPDGFVAARDAEVRRLRQAKDRDAASQLHALRRPGLAMWAVLAAGADAGLVSRVMDATAALLSVQTEPGSRQRLAEAIDERRTAVHAVVEQAVDALAESGKGASAAAQRDEIATIVDRVSRHPELAPAWLDATLRDVPEDTGFGAFEGAMVLAPERPPEPEPAAQRTPVAERKPAAERKPDAERGSAAKAALPEEVEPKRPRPPDRKALEAARRKVRDTDTAHDRAQRTVQTAERAVHAAERDVDRAEAALQTAQRHLTEANDALSQARAAEAAVATAREEARTALDALES